MGSPGAHFGSKLGSTKGLIIMKLLGCNCIIIWISSEAEVMQLMTYAHVLIGVSL